MPNNKHRQEKVQNDSIITERCSELNRSSKAPQLDGNVYWFTEYRPFLVIIKNSSHDNLMKKNMLIVVTNFKVQSF